MSVREPRNQGGRNFIGQFPSLKNDCMMSYESTIEEDLFYLLDFAAQVQHWEAQPIVIEYWYNSKVCRYTPDVLVSLANRDLLIECKPHEALGKPENQRKFEAARRYCAECGWEFHVITDLQLRAGHRLENVKLLTRYARHTPVPSLAAQIFSALRALSEETQLVTMIEVARMLAPDAPGTALGSILHLIYHHKIGADIDNAALTPGAFVWLPDLPPPSVPVFPLVPRSPDFSRSLGAGGSVAGANGDAGDAGAGASGISGTGGRGSAARGSGNVGSAHDLLPPSPAAPDLPFWP